MPIKFAAVFDPASELLSRINYTRKSFGSAKTAIYCILTYLNHTKPHSATRFTQIKNSSLGLSPSICAGVTSSSAVCGIVVLNVCVTHC